MFSWKSNKLNFFATFYNSLFSLFVRIPVHIKWFSIATIPRYLYSHSHTHIKHIKHITFIYYTALKRKKKKKETKSEKVKKNRSMNFSLSSEAKRTKRMRRWKSLNYYTRNCWIKLNSMLSHMENNARWMWVTVSIR